MPDFEIKTGDTYPFVSGFVCDANGLVDLASATEVKIHLRPSPGAPPLVEGVCVTFTITAGITAGWIEPERRITYDGIELDEADWVAWSGGELATEAGWRYEWDTGDTDVADDYVGEIQQTRADGRIQTFPNKVANNFTVKFGAELD